MIKFPSVLTWYWNNMIIKVLLLAILLFFTSFTNDKGSSSKNDPYIKIFDSNNSREKVYLHFDKPYYSSGDDIWFKVYLVDAITNQQAALSKIVYVELINFQNEIIDSREIHIEKGFGNGDFQLDDRLKSGPYLIRAYTNYMRNFDQAFFFRKIVQISSLLSTDINNDSINYDNFEIQSIQPQDSSLKPDVQFLPEGGHLISGFHNRVGFKALGMNGKGIDIQGTIIDQDGKKVSSFKSSKFGLGLFNLIPENGKTYSAQINYMNRDLYYDLPKSLITGVVVQVREFEDHFQFSLQSSLKNGVDKLTLIGYQKGEMVTESYLQTGQKRARVKVFKSVLGQGIARFILLDKDQNPLCERLIFVEKERVQKKINLKLSKDSYGKRERVEIDLSLDKTVKNADQTNMSVSITDVSVIDKNPYDLDIKSYLLLNSELKGDIENPGYYFMDEDLLRKRNLDILMLTQGWRKYLFAQKLNDSIEKFKYDQGIAISGRIVKDSKAEESMQAAVSLVIKENEQVIYEKIESDLKGQFDFGYFDIKDSASIIIQIENVKRNEAYKSTRNQYKIVMDTVVEPIKPLVSYSRKNNQFLIINEGSNHDDFIERSKSFQHINAMFKDDKNRELLNEVVVEQIVVKTERELKQEEFYNKMKRSTALYSEPTQRLDFSELTWTHGSVAEALQGQVSNISSGPTSIMGKGSTLVLLNNIPVSGDVLIAMPASSIHFVDILKRTKAAIYGSRASGGVIAIYTKDGTEKFFDTVTERKGILNFTQPGSYKAREFYEPKYHINKPEHKRPDVRSTLCWRPQIEFDENGKAKISFYSADIPTTYRVELEGITSDGIPIISETFINID